ncbi:flagellar export chaperone FliS [Rosenbergiella australiborealis]|uniref:Flagellar secretion chaperone FliS n=1 Tax=Rosenbergiella australiborealis TaxID=1544696 RepID=A0ABS5T7B2_9GAMM|nr:flagellar export chaperone FliS [Rosenbergiella australiborealis]MBT0728224.1 flagellar export chaperone FliS [Rosenbergiella australiborealis]
MKKQQLVNLYAQVGVESAVLSASQTQLTTLLFEGALNALTRARLSMESRDIAAKGAMIAKAVAIIDTGLIQALEPYAEDVLAKQLLSLFHYLIQQLMLANLHDDQGKLDHCRELLQNIAEAWQQSQDKDRVS